MKVVLCSSESLPFKKTGGLADVVDGLSKQLSKNNKVYVIMPQYGNINYDNYPLEHVGSYMMHLNEHDVYVGINKLLYEGVNYIFIDNLSLFGFRDNLYGYDDDCYRFGFFSKACLDAILMLDIKPDVIHLNDWHTAIVANYVRYEYSEKFTRCKLVLTIHNLAFQGITHDGCAESLLLTKNDSLYMNSEVNFLKCGIVLVDEINTVSLSYRNDTLSEPCGNGLSSALYLRRDNYYGILNGIDKNVFSPKGNENIYLEYDLLSYEQGKYYNKCVFKMEYSILSDDNRPFFSMITRLTTQKGIDLVLDKIDDISNEDIDLFILGDGDRYYIDALVEASKRYENVYVYIGYDEHLAHKLYACSDFFLMPSRFEPCGLSQIIALSFGAIPIVMNIHGLRDSVVGYEEVSKVGNGIKIDYMSSQCILDQIKYAIYLYDIPSHMGVLRNNAMSTDFSWELREKEYLKLYDV